MKRRVKISGSQSNSFTLSGLAAGLTVLLTTSCGGGPEVAAADAQIAKLLPDSTVAVMRIASLDQLNKHKRTITEDLGEADDGLGARDALAMAGLPGDPRLIDSNLPIVMAVTSKRATPPTVTAIVPTTNTEAFVKSLSDMGIVGTVDNNYVAVPVFGQYKRAETAPTIMANLKPGTLSIHADVEALAKTYKVMINSGIEIFEQQITAFMEMENPNLDGEVMAQIYGSMGRAISESAKTVGLSVNYKNGKLAVDVDIDALPGSAMAGWSSPAIDLSPLAVGMTGKGSIETVFQMNMEKIMPRFNDMIEAVADVYPEDFKVVIDALMSSYEAIYEQIESGFVMEGDLFGEDGVRMTTHMMPKDPAKYVDLILDMLKSDPMKTIGLTVAAPQTSTDGDTKICDINIAIDSKKLMAVAGPEGAQTEQTSQAFKAMFADGFNIRIAQRGERVVMTFGKGRETAASTTLDADQGTWSPAMEAAMERLDGCNPMFAQRTDMARMMSGVFATMAKSGMRIPPIPKNASANMLIYGGINGDAWRGGMQFDIAGLAELFEQLIPR